MHLQGVKGRMVNLPVVILLIGYDEGQMFAGRFFQKQSAFRPDGKFTIRYHCYIPPENLVG